MTTATDNKALVRRLVDEVINGKASTSSTSSARRSSLPSCEQPSQFRAAFPDWHQELVQLVAEDDTVVARFRCTGTQLGDWQGLAASGRAMAVDEVYFFRFADSRVAGMWGVEDTWTRMRQLAGDNATLGELGSLS